MHWYQYKKSKQLLVTISRQNPTTNHPRLVSYIQSTSPLRGYATIFFPLEDKRKHKRSLYLDGQVKLDEVVRLTIGVKLLLVLEHASWDHVQIC